jgi:mannose-6-phosphate isomerase-like protein (cupin superfamily)
MGTKPPFFTSLGDAPRQALRADRGESLRLVDGEQGGARNVDVHVNYLAAGSGPGPRHYHQVAENIYIVLSGVIEVNIEGDISKLEADDVLLIPPGVVHSTSNPGPHTATFIEIYAPAGNDFHIVDEPEED